MYITNTSDLEKLCKDLNNQDFITIDTEFFRETTYYPKLCLIQIATKDYSAIIDPLSPNIDLDHLNNILQNANIVKVFHSAKQDLEILYNLYGQMPKNSFDTQIAASFCGFGDYVSYETLVLDIVDKQIDKSHRISDWSLRPLTDEQIEYAHGDVTYLVDIYIYLLSKLKTNNRFSWAMEEMQILNNPSYFQINIGDAWQKIKNTRDIKINLLLKNLASWREKKAQEHDIPRNHFLNEKHLLKIMQNMPLTLKELKSIPYFNNIEETLAKEIIEIVQNSLIKPLEEDLNDKQSIYDNSNSEKLSKLKLLLKFKSNKYQLPPQLIATNLELKSLSNQTQYLKSPRFLRGWRYEIFGKLVTDIKKENK